MEELHKETKKRKSEKHSHEEIQAAQDLAEHASKGKKPKKPKVTEDEANAEEDILNQYMKTTGINSLTTTLVNTLQTVECKQKWLQTLSHRCASEDWYNDPENKYCTNVLAFTKLVLGDAVKKLKEYYAKRKYGKAICAKVVEKKNRKKEADKAKKELLKLNKQKEELANGKPEKLDEKDEDSAADAEEDIKKMLGEEPGSGDENNFNEEEFDI